MTAENKPKIAGWYLVEAYFNEDGEPTMYREPSYQDVKPVAYLKNLTDPQPHAVTDLKYCSMADHKNGDALNYIPVYAAPVEPVKQPVIPEWVDVDDYEEHDNLCQKSTELVEPVGISKTETTSEPRKSDIGTWHRPGCEGECIGCLIERAVKDAYGTAGLVYMLRHINSTAPVEPVKSEPVEFQARVRPLFGSNEWSNWDKCSKEQADDYRRVPKFHDWEYEVRELYTTPQPRQDVDLTDDDLCELRNAQAPAMVLPTEFNDFARAVIAKYKEKNK